MQNRPPALLSTTEFDGKPFVLQEIQPTKDKINFNLIKKEYRSIYQVITDMSSLTAYSHLRSSGRQGSAIADELIEFGQDSQWQEIVFQSANRYAKRLQFYYKQYLKDYGAGVFRANPKIIKISA